MCGRRPRTEVECGRDFDTHHILFQSSADGCGRVDEGRRGQNDLHNLVVLCKEDHQRVHRGEIWIRGWKKTSQGRVLDWGENAERCENSGRKRYIGKKELTPEFMAQVRPWIEEGKRTGRWKHVVAQIRWKFGVHTTEKRLLELDQEMNQ